ncbi:MAG: BPSS1780 family membrane protein [Gammaproteobacteria bacterium]
MNTIEVQQLPAGRGAEWLSQGWGLFKQAPGIWIGLIVIWMLLAIASDFVPVAGALALNLVAPALTAGLCIGCRSLEDGQGLRIGHLFAAFQTDRIGPLIIVGALGLAGVVVLVLVAMLLGMGFALGGGMHDMEGMDGMGPGMLLAGLLVLALAVPLAMALWFAPPLVALDGIAPVDSLRLSFQACLRNFVPLLVWGLLAFVLLDVAAIPLLLGWLIAVPLLAAAYYRMYREIFAARTAPLP